MTVAAAESVAVDQEEGPAARHQVTVQRARLQKAQAAGQPQQPHGVPLQEGLVDGRGERD